MRKASDELITARDQLAGVFDFKAWDRFAQDTRFPQVSYIPPPKIRNAIQPTTKD